MGPALTHKNNLTHANLMHAPASGLISPEWARATPELRGAGGLRHPAFGGSRALGDVLTLSSRVGARSTAFGQHCVSSNHSVRAACTAKKRRCGQVDLLPRASRGTIMRPNLIREGGARGPWRC